MITGTLGRAAFTFGSISSPLMPGILMSEKIRISNGSARRTIDAKGLIVAPGFIDLHSHSDFTLVADGKAESKIRQGVTTEILGESESAGPVLGPAIPLLDKELATMGLKRTWGTLGEYFITLQKHGIAVNIASYVGSGQVRLDVMGNVNRAPSPAELNQMKALVDQAMRDGAVGLASGLIYPPNAFAKTDEIVELAKVAARYGGIYTSHIRDEGDHEPEADKPRLTEFFEKARELFPDTTLEIVSRGQH